MGDCKNNPRPRSPLTREILSLVLPALLSGLAVACQAGSLPAARLTTPLSSSGTAPTGPPTSTHAPTPTPEPGSIAEATPVRKSISCFIGTGLRRESLSTVLSFRGHNGMVMAGSSALAERYFPQFEGWIRILGAPSLADLERKAARAKENSTPYEALSYGLETSASTPREEWQNLVQSAQSARAIADRYGKLLVMGPGLRLMTQNEDQYPAMAALADIWMIQTQRLQANPPGGIYRREVMTVIDSIRSGNPQIKIWAQITFPPDQDPNAQDWMAYRDSIADLVHGIYMGVYHWNADNEEKLNSAISAVFTNACGGGANP